MAGRSYYHRGMRGDDREPGALFSYISTEARVPVDHPLRAMRLLVDDILQQMSPEFDALYAAGGRPSIPPERLLRAQLLQMFYTVRSERLLMEQLDYNILFRWFVGLELDEPIWDPTVFTKNRDRLLTQAVAQRFFQLVVAQATRATGTAEREAAIQLLRAHGVGAGCTLGADKNYDTREFVARARALGVTPHVSQNVKRTGGSAIDARTTRYDGYEQSQSCRPRVERVFGWIKPIAGLRKIKLRGLAHVEWLFVFACAAFNVKRLTALRAAWAAA